jgi:GT2 family glycosyltransferase
MITISPGGLGVLRVSIVLYAPDENLLRDTLRSLVESSKGAIKKELTGQVEIFLVNNGPAPEILEALNVLISDIKNDPSKGIAFKIIGNGENVGFGTGHNLTFDPDSCNFHLVLNPDVEIAIDALANALEFMHKNPACGMLAPAVKNGSGDVEYLCKRYPSVIDLTLRGFAPDWLRALFRRRLSAYEMRDKIGSKPLLGPPIISGCFMLLRAPVLKKTKGFDPAFFLYFEDFDLSLRAGKVSQTAYVPSVEIVHHGGNAARKGLRHIYLFVRSSILFFNRHGWKWI